MARETANSINNPVPLECITSGSRVKGLVNNIAASALSENPFNPLHYVPMERRRDAWGVITKFLFPGVFPNEGLTKPPGLQRAEDLVSDGYGLVVATRHFSSRDFLMLTGFFRNQSEISHKKEIYTPLAYHQYTKAAKALLEYFGVIPWPIVTKETHKRGKNYDAFGNKLKLGTGGAQYKEATVSLLNHGGILFVAPSATRMSVHEPWRLMQPIGMVVEGTGDKVAFMCVGLDIEDPTVTSYEKYRGYNFRTPYIINIGETFTKQELQRRAYEKGVTVDRLMADEMALLIRPQTLGEAYRELREQRLTQNKYEVQAGIGPAQ